MNNWSEELRLNAVLEEQKPQTSHVFNNMSNRIQWECSLEYLNFGFVDSFLYYINAMILFLEILDSRTA